MTCETCHIRKIAAGNFRRSWNSKTGYEYQCQECKKEACIVAEKRRQEQQEEKGRQQHEEWQRGMEGKENDAKKKKGDGRSLLFSNVPLQKEHRSPIQVIYTLVDPRTSAVHYVGRTGKPERRYKSHLYPRAGYSCSHSKEEWILELRALGLRPLMVIVENVTPTRKVREREMRWLYHYFQQRAPLTNIEAEKLPRLVKAIQSTQIDFLTEPLRSSVWYPLYCAEQLDIEGLHKMRDERSIQRE